MFLVGEESGLFTHNCYTRKVKNKTRVQLGSVTNKAIEIYTERIPHLQLFIPQIIPNAQVSECLGECVNKYLCLKLINGTGHNFENFRDAVMNLPMINFQGGIL